MSPEAAAEAVKSQLALAVKRQLVADVPVGAFLSGGLDSSAVVALAQHADYDPKRKCFTIGFEGEANPQGDGRVDDLPYAQRAAKRLNVDLKTIYLSLTCLRIADPLLCFCLKVMVLWTGWLEGVCVKRREMFACILEDIQARDPCLV